MTTKKALCSWDGWGGVFCTSGSPTALCMASCMNRCRNKVVTVFDWASNADTFLYTLDSTDFQSRRTFISKGKRVYQFSLPDGEGREVRGLHLVCVLQSAPNCSQIGRKTRHVATGTQRAGTRRSDCWFFSRVLAFLFYFVFHHHRIYWLTLRNEKAIFILSHFIVVVRKQSYTRFSFSSCHIYF